ncbi:MAG: amino acid permease [Acidobacteriota bacterium]|nr:amino acid permease [Acidobacteriota bacterium]
MNPRPASEETSPDLPETAGYRLKRRLLGPPLVSDQLHEERLGKPTGLAVLSSDVMSSAAYASESVLRILVPVAGLGAFALITPITGLLLVVLGVVCLCYRNVVEAYPVSGGSYVVSRENFGYAAAQIPGAALLCSYTLTVAVSVAAGVDAVLSAFPGLKVSPTVLSVIFVLVLTFGNLRGIREAGKVFAVPTYWFIASMAVLIGAAVVRYLLDGGLPHIAPAAGQMHAAPAGPGLLLGASLFIVLRGFANGGSAMTGMEAISNAVTVFREPQVRNARTTLMLMASIIGFLFLAVSALAALTHAVPFHHGTPTVLSEIGSFVFGASPLGRVAYYSLQFSTALILVLGANTSFNGFPLLVSFIARDSYLPRRLTTRGHRLVYSNGIILLSFLSVALLVVTRASVASLIPLYATTVFTGFTMAGAGMTRFHLTHPGPDRRRGLIVNGTAAAVSAVVTLIFVVTEFTRGAWAVVVVIPLIIFGLSRTHRLYQSEREVLAEEVAPALAAEKMLSRQEVVVLVDRVDLATARALQLARSLASGGQVRAVHFAVDEERSERVAQSWAKLGLGTVALQVVECPDRRLVRAVTELADSLASDGETEVLLILPRRAGHGVVGRFLHDQTADRLVAAVTAIPHVSATIAPFDVRELLERRSRPGAVDLQAAPTRPKPEPTEGRHLGVSLPGLTPIGDLKHRQRAKVAGRVRAISVQPWSGVPTFECVLVDGSGALTIAFLGRQQVAGIEPGAKLMVEGAVGSHRGQLAMLNPMWEYLEPIKRSQSG